MPYYYRLRIRNATDSSDALTVTSVPAGTSPYISDAPSGDGQSFDPRTGSTTVGAYSVRIADNGSAANVITGFLSDGSGRYDKLGRIAYLDYGTDGATFPNLLVAGYVTAISYPSAAEAQVTVGEAQRAERTKQAFVTASTNFPATTMLAGGPVKWPSGVNPPVTMPNYGRWTVKRFDTPVGAATTFLQFVSGYVLDSDMAANFTFTGLDRWVLAHTGAFPLYMQSRINTLTATEVPGSTVLASTGVYRHGNVYADVYSGDTFIGTFNGATQRSDLFMGNGGFFLLDWVNADAAGTLYQVYLYTRTVSENSPLHVFSHPMDVVTGLISDAGETYDATTAASVKASIGADVRVFLRITSATQTDAFIAKVQGLFGFGRRINAANTWEFFDGRTKTTSAPGTTITYADLREIPTDVWSLADSTILNNVTVTTQKFAVWNPGQSSTRPPDGLIPVEQKRTARFQLSDGTFPETSQGVKELSYDLPGTITNAKGSEVNLTDFTKALAAPSFDRWGYGAPSTGLRCRPTVTAQIGDEVVFDLPFLPNANVRGGQRIVQLTQRTNEPGGPVIVVEDAGLSAQPATAPTFTITAAARSASTAADITLTNAAALITAGVSWVVVEWAVSASSPVVAGQDLGVIEPPTPLVLTTPLVAAGSKVWARCKSVAPGKRNGAFTSWASVTLSGVSAASSLAFTATAGDGSAGSIGWTAGAGSATYGVRVLNRLSALTSASDFLVADLSPGSTGVPIINLTPGSSYTATVQYIDRTSGIVAVSATLTYTAGASTLTLSPPTRAYGVVGNTLPNGVMRIDGTYGLDCKAAHIPGTIEFSEQVETVVGSGAYGALTVIGAPTPAVSGGVTSVRAVAPHDGLRRRLTARHVKTGAASSPYTLPVALDPWGAILSPPVVAELRDVRESYTDTTVTITWTRSSSVDSVWVASLLVTGAPTSANWDTVATAAGPLLVDTYTVNRPADGQVMLVQLEPRYDDLSPGTVRRFIITAVPQPPTVQYDDIETATKGTQWIRLTERGIAVNAVTAQTQVETSQFTAFLAPTRGPGGTSLVKGGTLGALEYEQDVALSAVKGRQSFIRYQWALANGKTVTSPDFAFDADKTPNIIRTTATLAVVSLEGDSDVQSWRVVSGAWSLLRDGQFLTLDLSLADDIGTAGLAANTSATYTVTAYNVPVSQQTTSPGPSYRRTTSVDVFVYNGTGSGGAGGSPAATWATFTAVGPSADGLSDLTITLKATSAPGGWTTKLFLRDPNSATAVDITASTVPAAGAVPVVNTSYVYTLPFPRLPSDDPSAVTRYVGVVAQLYNGASLMYTQTKLAAYLASSAS